jgi:hypothetical protein
MTPYIAAKTPQNFHSNTAVNAAVNAMISPGVLPVFSTRYNQANIRDFSLQVIGRHGDGR